MEITNKKINLLRLWVESFSVVNRCTGKLAAAILCSLLLLAIVIAILAFGFGASALFAQFQMAVLTKTMNITALFVYVLFVLFTNVYGLFFMTVCWQIEAAEALGQKRPLSDFFAGSVLPTLYQIVAAILLSIPYIIIVIVLSLTKSSLFVAIGMIGVFLLAVRICYSFIAIAVANKGPIEGIQLSWELTEGKNYWDTLLMCVLSVLSVLLVEVGIFLVGYAFYTYIPLYFAQSFSLAHPSLIWWLVGFVALLVVVFIYFALMAFPVLVFLNRHAQLMPNAQKQEDENIFIPLPELETPLSEAQTTPNDAAPAAIEPLGEQLPQDKKPLAEEPQPAAPTAPVPPPPPAPKLEQGLEELEVSQSSIHTKKEDLHEITQHLDKVYTPKPEDLVQYGDEDRMPTILFDDDMAKQLQEHGMPSAQPETNHKDNPPDDTPIKMSK